MRIDALLVILTALALALAAWGVLALLERFTRNARRVWTIVAVAVLVVSLPPLAFLDATAGTKVALAVMHVATGLVLIFMLRRGARTE
jgi:predicted permease